jgi:uncharacterized membrane protein
MNPLTSIKGTIALGFVLAILAALFVFPTAEDFTLNTARLIVWLHVIFGITWIGLLYYFNFVQVPAMGEALADEGGPGPAAIGKYVAPRALLWFRMSAAMTWLTGAAALENFSTTEGGSGLVNAFTFSQGYEVIGLGAWLGTIMLFNVWAIIWPCQKKILGIVKASAEEIAKAKFTAAMASRTNVALSVPMLLAMTLSAHGQMLF